MGCGGGHCDPNNPNCDESNPSCAYYERPSEDELIDKAMDSHEELYGCRYGE